MTYEAQKSALAKEERLKSRASDTQEHSSASQLRQPQYSSGS
jgi:hypothetical protein